MGRQEEGMAGLAETADEAPRSGQIDAIVPHNAAKGKTKRRGQTRVRKSRVRAAVSGMGHGEPLEAKEFAEGQESTIYDRPTNAVAWTQH